MKTTSNQKSQVDKFREAARELETDESEDAFDRLVKKVAKSSPPKDNNVKKADQ